MLETGQPKTGLSETGLRHELVRIAHLMHRQGLIAGGEGNLSARLDDGTILVTPTGVHKGLLEPQQLLVVDAGGALARPHTLAPSGELPMHLEAYHRRPDVRAVIHAHPPHAIALSLTGVVTGGFVADDYLLPEIIILLGRIPVIPFTMPASAENAGAIRVPVQAHDALILQRHGALTVGDTLREAFMNLEILEQNARIAMLLLQTGTRAPYTADDLDRLRRYRPGG